MRLVYGAGDSGIVARAIQYRLAKLGIPIQFSEDVAFTAAMAFRLEENDVFFAVSHSGKSDPTLRMARYAKSNGAQVISITNFPASPLARISDVVLFNGGVLGTYLWGKYVKAHGRNVYSRDIGRMHGITREKQNTYEQRAKNR